MTFKIELNADTVEIYLCPEGREAMAAPCYTGTAYDILEAIAFRGAASEAMETLLNDLRERKGTPGERMVSIRNFTMMKNALRMIGLER